MARYARIFALMGALACVSLMFGCTHQEVPQTENRYLRLERTLRSGDEAERREALDELYEMGAESIDILRPLMGSPDPELRRRAIWVLSNAGPDAFRHVATMARYDKNAEVRYDAVLALGGFFDQPGRVIPVLRYALLDEDKWVRLAAIETLVVVGDPTVLEALEARTRDEDRLVRSAAVSALETLKVE